MAKLMGRHPRRLDASRAVNLSTAYASAPIRLHVLALRRPQYGVGSLLGLKIAYQNRQEGKTGPLLRKGASELPFIGQIGVPMTRGLYNSVQFRRVGSLKIVRDSGCLAF